METMNPGRRLFLRNLGALAALAVAPGTLTALAPSDDARLLSAMRSGLVENQTFLVTRPIVLDFVDGLMIRNCLFRAAATFPHGEPMIEISTRARNVVIHSCVFQEYVSILTGSWAAYD